MEFTIVEANLAGSGRSEKSKHGEIFRPSSGELGKLFLVKAVLTSELLAMQANLGTEGIRIRNRRNSLLSFAKKPSIFLLSFFILNSNSQWGYNSRKLILKHPSHHP